MKTGKTGKTKQLFGPDIKDSKTDFKYKIRPEFCPVKLFILRSSISPLKIRKKKFASQIYICRFHRAAFKKSQSQFFKISYLKTVLES